MNKSSAKRILHVVGPGAEALSQVPRYSLFNLFLS